MSLRWVALLAVVAVLGCTQPVDDTCVAITNTDLAALLRAKAGLDACESQRAVDADEVQGFLTGCEERVAAVEERADGLASVLDQATGVVVPVRSWWDSPTVGFIAGVGLTVAIVYAVR